MATLGRVEDRLIAVEAALGRLEQQSLEAEAALRSLLAKVEQLGGDGTVTRPFLWVDPYPPELERPPAKVGNSG